MKRLFLAVCTVAVLASCSKEELVSYDKSSVINFGNAFVDKSTRTAIDPSYTTGNITAFAVYGAAETNTADDYTNIFDGVTVTKTKQADTDITADGAWYYPIANLQYWIEGRDYKFAAVAGATVATVDGDGMPATITVTDGGDFIYDKITMSSVSAAPGVVKFTFEHLMSKVKFIAKTANLAPAYYYTVENIVIENIANGGTYTIANESWSDLNSTNDTSFGNITTASTTGAAATPLQGTSTTESNWERLFIPQTTISVADPKSGTWVTFTVTLRKKVGADPVPASDPVISQENKEIGLDQTLEAGHAYNFIINLPTPGNQITFGVQTITGWNYDTNDDKTVDANDDITVQ